MREEIRIRIDEINQGIVPDGYKETRVGIVPEEWEVKKLGEIAEFKNGINKSADDFGHGVPFVNLMNVFGHKVVDDSSLELVNATEREIKNYNLIKGDVLIIRSSVKPTGVGLTSIIENDLKNTVYSGFIIRARISSDILDINYKKYCFDSNYFRNDVMSKATVSANTNINQQSLNILKVLIPSLKEQEKIADILSTWDRAIELKEEIIDQKEEQKKGLMQKLLTGEVRLHGFEEEWEKVRLDGLFSLKQGVQCNVENQFNENANGRVRFIRIVDITKSDEETRYILDPGENHHIKEKDLFMVRYGSPGLISRGYEGVIANNLFRLVPLKDIDTEYFYYKFKRKERYIYSLSTSSTMPAISFGDLYAIKLLIPSLPEQKAIAEILSTADREIDLLKEQVENLREQKKGLMQLLLTGIVRVN